MPLPQQDEFGVYFENGEFAKDELSQCRFRSKMNSEPYDFISQIKIDPESQRRFRSKMNSESTPF